MTLDLDQSLPKENDISVCVKCYEPSFYDENLKLEPLDISLIGLDDLKEIKKIQTLLKKRKQHVKKNIHSDRH